MINIYDKAKKWNILEGHTGAISDLVFYKNKIRAKYLDF
jgi:hypothetical protein